MKPQHDTHKGWSNLATFTVAYDLTDTQEKYQYWRNQVQWWMKTDAHPVTSLAKNIELFTRSRSPLSPRCTSCVHINLLNQALDSVDWVEIAEERIAHEKECETNVLE